MPLETRPNVKVIQGDYFDGWDKQDDLINVHFHNTANGGTVSSYTISLRYAIRDEVTDDEGNISFDFGGLSAIAVNTTVYNQNGVSEHFSLTAIDNGQTVTIVDKETNMSDPINVYQDLTPKWEHFTLAPQESLDFTDYALAHLLNYVGPGLNDEFEFNVGGKAVTNTNPPLYRSRSIWQNGSFKSLNAGGITQLWYNGGWQDQPMQNYGNINKPNVGSRLIYEDGDWYPQTKTGD